MGKNGIKWPASSLILFFLLFCLPPSVCAQSSDPLRLQVDGAVLADAHSGKILYQKNADQPLALASMTKILTEYIILEAINQQKLSWEDTTAISDYAYRISQNLSLSNVPLRPDEKYSVRELYESMAIYSANGATIALAEMVAGSEGEFVRLMNNKAKEIGMTNYSFVNATGLNNSDLLGMHPAGARNEENFASAKDVALMAFRILRDYPEVLTIASIPRKTFRPDSADAIKMDNWNWMLPELVYGYEGVDGLKTGSTSLAGYCFTATAQRNGVRLISVVMKGRSYAGRFQETKKLLDYGFNNFERKELFPAGYQKPAQATIPVRKGKAKTVTIAASKPLTILIKRGETERYEPELELESAELTAPIPKGHVVGRLYANYTGEKREYLTPEGSTLESVPLVTTEEVKKAGFFRLIFQQIAAFFSWLARQIQNLF
ncbi:MAG TPA: D-alanyl-D-alanine carboxypeptidase [Firmicutes bacterium]|nr:D-alanyl-D-alanine carboxypeptidase [Bacillota bacterium]